MSSAASAGDPEAQYVTAEALMYCDDGLNRFFRKPSGQVRSLNEAQIRWTNRPSGYQQEIVDICMARERGAVKLFDRGFESIDELKGRCEAETGLPPPAQPQFSQQARPRTTADVQREMCSPSTQLTDR